MIPINRDTLATYLMTSLHCEVMRDPKGFIDTLADFDQDLEHFADILMIDEFDVPDDMRFMFEVGEGDEARDQQLFDLKHDQQLFILVVEAVRRYAALAPSLIPKEN